MIDFYCYYTHKYYYSVSTALKCDAGLVLNVTCC